MAHPHLPREALIEKLHDAVSSSPFVVICAPSASGKSSLLLLYAARHPEVRCISIVFADPKVNATSILFNKGVDLVHKTCSSELPSDRLCVFLLDDCHRQYQDKSFWACLLDSSTSSWLLRHIHCVISATFLLETMIPTRNVVFGNLPRMLERDDFLVDDAEAHQLLTMSNGLPPNTRFPTLMEVIKRDCKGHIGSLRMAMDSIDRERKLRKMPVPPEHEVLKFYLSDQWADFLDRCFWSRHGHPPTVRLQRYLLKGWMRSVESNQAGQPGSRPVQWTEVEAPYVTRLMMAGIIRQDGDTGHMGFTSPLAARYYANNWLLPTRPYTDPPSLHELIRVVIRSMSASMLRQSCVGYHDDDVGLPPNEAFQFQFLMGLAQHTSRGLNLDLPQLFPASGEQQDVDGNEVVFYLNAELHWGVELHLVDRASTGAHTDRRISGFSAGGKYGALAVREHVVVDLDLEGTRGGSVPPNVPRDSERITMVFKRGEMSYCHCIFGLQGDAERIMLAS